MFDIQKSAKTLSIAAALLALPAAAASAQTVDYGVSANVQTLGMPGGFSNYSNGLPLDNFEYRESDPAGGYWGNTVNNTVWADGAARAWAQPGELRVKTDATADALSAKNFSNSHPYGFAEVRFWDNVTVKSDTLPAGTPVTLIFRSDLDVVQLSGTGVYSGSFYGEHRIAGRSVSQQIYFDNNDMDYQVSLGLITVNTKVGARFAMSGRLYVSTHASYWGYQGTTRIYSGQLAGEMTLKPILESASADAYLLADSGASYFVAPAN